MASEAIERLHYYQRQYLGAVDFQAQQNYHRDMRRRHNLGAHTWGIIVGLELQEREAEGGNGQDIYVQPGLAVDGFGREIIVLRPFKLDAVLFDAFNNQQHREVWIAYDESRARRPAFGFELCEEDEQFARVQESYRIVVEPKPPTHDPVIVAGKVTGTPPPPNPGDLTIPADEAVPYQELPDDEDRPRWLVRLGSVNWDGIGRKFEKAAPERLLEERRYAQVVAAGVLAPAATLRLRPRLAPADVDAADFASVEGRLRVDGRLVAKKDVLLHGGKLAFESISPQSTDPPLWMQRRDGPGGTGVDLRIHIGDDPAAATRLSIGPGPADGSAEKTVLAVKGDDTVDVPTGSLNFGRQTRQMLNLWTSAGGKHEYGIGVQASTTYFRSHNEFCWFKDGEHNDAQSNPGPGGSLQLRLDDQARLHFGAQTRQMLNLWQTEYGIGVQNSTLYNRTSGDFCWFRGGSHSDTRSDPGAGGTLVMKLDDANRLTVNGDVNITGNLRISDPRNVCKVFTRALAVKNAGQNSPGNWSAGYAGEFSQVYTAFAVLQGYSLWNYENNPAFTPNSGNHVASASAIVQHVFVRVDGFNTNGAHGVAYCSESSANNETDNTVLFTLVVIGRNG